MVTDCHVNIWNDEHVLPHFRTAQARVREKGIPDKSDAETIIRAMAPVDRAIIFTLAYGETVGIDGNDDVTADAVRRYPDKLTGFSYCDPRRPDALDRLIHAHKELGLKGVKYGPIYNGVPLDDPRLEPIYAYCGANDLPLTMHMGTTYTRLYEAELGRPMIVEEVALKHPDLKLVMAHMAHPWFEECIAVIRKQPNVYAEISAIYYRRWQFYNVMTAIEEYQVTDKVFFGSDFPFSAPAEGIELTRAVRDIGGTNGMPRVSEETVERIITSDPFAHWWHTNPLG
jgi:predicted TIM-barrel fold metal-dependent hydrolase